MGKARKRRRLSLGITKDSCFVDGKLVGILTPVEKQDPDMEKDFAFIRLGNVEDRYHLRELIPLLEPCTLNCAECDIAITSLFSRNHKPREGCITEDFLRRHRKVFPDAFPDYVDVD